MRRWLEKSLLVVGYALLCCIVIGTVPACSNPRITGVEKYGHAITKVHFVSNQLLTSKELKWVVGVPSTNAMVEEWRAVMKATNDAPPFSAQRKRAEEQEHLTIAVLNGVLGNWFMVDTLPATSNLLFFAFDDTWVVAHKAKAFHYKPRPIEIPGNSSYPSAHAAEGIVLTGIVAMLDATHKNEAENLGKEIGENRLILQRHFPSDIQAGQQLGKWLLMRMTESQAFQKDLVAAQREIELRMKQLGNNL